MSFPRIGKLGLGAIALLAGRAEISAREFTVDTFSGQAQEGGLPQGWEHLTFKKVPRHTQYSIARENGNIFVKAVSQKAASALFKDIGLDPREYPVLKWRWKVENLIAKADAKRKSGDDYPARVYVAFQYDPAKASVWEKAKYGAAKRLYGRYPPKAVLNYIWDNKLPVGTAVDNAYTDRAKMIVTQSGNENLGKWISEEKNVYEDFKRLFGSEPPKISFIAVMTDTDNTGERAVAYFDDIAFQGDAGSLIKQMMQ